MKTEALVATRASPSSYTPAAPEPQKNPHLPQNNPPVPQSRLCKIRIHASRAAAIAQHWTQRIHFNITDSPMTQLRRSLLPAIACALALAATACQGPGGGFAAPTQIQGMKVNPIKVLPDAYRPPVGSEADVTHGWGDRAGYLIGENRLIGAASGYAVRGIAQGQQNDFDERNRDALASIQTSMQREVPVAVHGAILATLKTTALGPRLDKKPFDSTLYVDLESFGLIRIGLSKSGEVLLAPQITFRIQTTSGQVLVNGAWVNMDATNGTRDFSKVRLNKAGFWTCSRLATGTIGHTLREYATNTALLRTELNNTVTSSLQNVPRQVAQQFGSK